MMTGKYSHQLLTGLSFGLTSAIITSLGMMVGLNSATSSKLAVGSGLIVMAVSDGLADAMGLHLAEEVELEKGKVKHTPKEVWLTTIFTFLSVCGFCLTFVIPILLFPLKVAILVAVVWGMVALIVFNVYIAKIKKENPIKLVSEHVLLAVLVVIVCHWVGNLVKTWF